MAPRTQRVLKRQGQVKLLETANPAIGVGYSVWDRNLGLWSGESLIEAEREFERALATAPPPIH